MADLNKRIVAGLLSLTLALVAVACGDGEEDPANTTTPSDTTAPVGS